MTSSPPQRRARGDAASDTRDLLVAAAGRVVARRGIAGATSREITDEAGTNLASITYHFGSKDDLVATALADEIATLVEPALRLLEGDDDPAARMVATVRLLLERFDAERDRTPLYLEALTVAARGGAGAGVARSTLAELRARIGAVAGDLRSQRAIPGWVDPDAMAGVVVAVAHGIALQVAIDPGGCDPERMAAEFAGLLLAVRP